jgi:hypothetical protein
MLIANICLFIYPWLNDTASTAKVHNRMTGKARDSISAISGIRKMVPLDAGTTPTDERELNDALNRSDYTASSNGMMS